MNYSFSNRATNVPNSGIGYMMRYAAKYPDVVSLGQGTPLFPTPPFIYDYLHQRSQTDPTIGQYSLPKIENELKDLILAQMEKLYGFQPAREEIYLTVGGIGGLFAAIMALVQEGDEVICFDPSYPLHLSQIHIAQAKTVFVSYIEEKGWAIDLEKLEKSISPQTKLIILTNPNNPTGTILSEQEVKKLAEIVLKNNLLLLLDAAYDFLTYENTIFSPLLLPELRNNIIVAKSFSKEFAMTGWRIGYVYAAPELIAKINDIHVCFSVCPPTPSIVAAIAALSDPRGEQATQNFKRKFSESRNAICSRLNNLPKLFQYHKPQGAYYVFPKILGFEDLSSFDFAKLLVDEAKVVTVPGDSAGPAGARHLRLSFAADPSVINQAFDRLDQFAKEHKAT